MKPIKKLLGRLQRFLSEEARHDAAQLQLVKAKLDKLKRKIRRMERLVQRSKDDDARERLREEIALAKAVRKKALAKYRELRQSAAHP